MQRRDGATARMIATRSSAAPQIPVGRSPITTRNAAAAGRTGPVAPRLLGIRERATIPRPPLSWAIALVLISLIRGTLGLGSRCSRGCWQRLIGARMPSYPVATTPIYRMLGCRVESPESWPVKKSLTLLGLLRRCLETGPAFRICFLQEFAWMNL